MDGLYLLDHLFLCNIPYHNTQNPTIHQKEPQRRHPQARHKGALAEKLELEALLQPGRLGENPQRERRQAAPRPVEEGGMG